MLEALLENPFIIIILLGVLSSLFGKGKAKEEQQRQQRPQQSQRQPQQPQAQPRKMTQPSVPQRDLQTERVDTFEQERRVQPSVFETVQTEIETEFEKQRRAHADRLKVLEAERFALEKRAEDIHTGLNKHPKMMPTTCKVTTNDPLPSYSSRLVEGIVLAEILGKPRAKNPHRERL